MDALSRQRKFVVYTAEGNAALRQSGEVSIDLRFIPCRGSCFALFSRHIFLANQSWRNEALRTQNTRRWYPTTLSSRPRPSFVASACQSRVNRTRLKKRRCPSSQKLQRVCCMNVPCLSIGNDSTAKSKFRNAPGTINPIVC